MLLHGQIDILRVRRKRKKKLLLKKKYGCCERRLFGWGRYGQVCFFNISPSPALSLIFGRGGGTSGDHGDFPLDF
jgi:hypothetical protein